MPRKRNDPLHGQQGFAMILVLCLGALFVALAAALVYAASLMLSNADRQLPEQDVYELATSFSDVLEQELLNYTGLNKDGTVNADQSLGYFINHIYVKKNSLENPYGDDTNHVFPLQAPEGVDELTVTLSKHPSDDVDESSNVLKFYDIAENKSMLDLSDKLESEKDEYNEEAEKYNIKRSDNEAVVEDYEITVTVKVVKGEQSYACTRKYRHVGCYQIYYTFNNSNNEFVKYGLNGKDALVFYDVVDQATTLKTGDTGTVYMRYRMNDSECRFVCINSNDE